MNEILIVEEKTGDPRFRKSIWPPEELCPSCYVTRSQEGVENSWSDWNHDGVFNFLVSYYGKMLSTVYRDKELAKDSSSSASFVVPLVAVLAIVVASCAFGALAYLWRSRQKNRKYFHQLHSLKNI